ncbi:MAG TPA: hypothetical protein VNS09_02230 [Solirubrobacter sp.]|nr:hypothetical protein [Solirubrobacter sp.]
MIVYLLGVSPAALFVPSAAVAAARIPTEITLDAPKSVKVNRLFKLKGAISGGVTSGEVRITLKVHGRNAGGIVLPIGQDGKFKWNGTNTVTSQPGSFQIVARYRGDSDHAPSKAIVTVKVVKR